MYNYNIKKIALAVVIITIIIILFFNFAVFSPLKNELETSLENNFLNKVSIIEISIENRLARYIEGSKSLSSRTMIKNQLIKYDEGETTLENLKEYTQAKYIDGVKVLDNILGAIRITDSKLIAKYGEINFKKIISIYDNSSNKIIIKLIDNKNSILVNSPILNNRGHKIANVRTQVRQKRLYSRI
jgi:hypothetical protein